MLTYLYTSVSVIIGHQILKYLPFKKSIKKIWYNSVMCHLKQFHFIQSVYKRFLAKLATNTNFNKPL